MLQGHCRGMGEREVRVHVTGTCSKCYKPPPSTRHPYVLLAHLDRGQHAEVLLGKITQHVDVQLHR